MNDSRNIIYANENCFYEDTNHDRYFSQFRKCGETYNMGDCALIQAEEMTLNPNRELIEEDFRREDSEIIFAYFDRVKTSPNKIIELSRILEENGVVMCDGIEVSKDMVLIHSPPLHICEIQCIWLQRNDLYVECKRYYRPEETHDGFKPALHGKQEVFDSRYFDIYKVEAIVGKASVQPRDEYMKRKDFPPNSFFAYGFYDWFTQKVSGPVEVTKDSDKWCFRRKNISRYLEKSTPTQHSQLRDLIIKDKELPNDREPLSPSKFPTPPSKPRSQAAPTTSIQSQSSQKPIHKVRASLAIEIPSTPTKTDRERAEESERKGLMVKVSVKVQTPQEDDDELLQVAIVDTKKTVERPKEVEYSEKLLEGSGSQVKEFGNVSIYSEMDGCDNGAMDASDLFADNFQLNASTESHLMHGDVGVGILSEKESEQSSEEIEVITNVPAAKIDSNLAKVVESAFPRQSSTVGSVLAQPAVNIHEERVPTRENIFLLHDSQLLEELEDENQDDRPAKQKKRLKKKGARNSDAFVQRLKDKRRKNADKDGYSSSSSQSSENELQDEPKSIKTKPKLDFQLTDSDMDGSSPQDPPQCYCGSHYDDMTMLRCRLCAQWFHSICVGMKDEDARKMKKKHRYVCSTCLDDENGDRRPKKGKKDKKARDELLAPTAGAQSLRISPRKVVSKTEKAKQYLEDPPTIYNLDLGHDEKAKKDKLRISSVNSADSQAARFDVADDDNKFDWSDRSERGKSPVKPALLVQERKDGDRMAFMANRMYSEMMKRDKPAQAQGPPESELTRKLKEKERKERAAKSAESKNDKLAVVQEDSTPVVDLTKQTKLDKFFKKEKKSEGPAIVTIDPNIISDENDSEVEKMSEDSDANEKDNSLDDLNHFLQAQTNAFCTSPPTNSQEKIGTKAVTSLPSPPRPAKRSAERPPERYPHNERMRAEIDIDPIISSDSDEEPVPKKGLWKVDVRRRSLEQGRVRLGDSDSSKSDDEYPSRFGKFAMKGKKTQAPARGLNGWPSPKKTSPTKAELQRERERRKERERERERDYERLCADSSHDSEVEIVSATKPKLKEPLKKENSSPIKSISQLDLSCLISEEIDWETPSQLITHLEYASSLDSTSAKGKSHARAQGKSQGFSSPTSHLFPSPRPDSFSEADEDIVVLHATSGKNGTRPNLKSELGIKPQGRKRTTRIDDYYSSSQPASASNQAPSDDEEAQEEMKDFIVADDEDLSLVDSRDESDSDSERIHKSKKRKKRRKSHQHSLEEEDKQFMTKYCKVAGSLKQHFGIYLQFIFSFCLDPEAFDRPFARSQEGDTTDEYFNRSIKRVHDAIAMKKNSLVQSNAWDAEFKIQLERLPTFKTSQGLGHGEGHCMACNRSHSTATVAVVLEGRPYNSKKFWDGDMLKYLQNDKDDLSLIYHLGRHCCKRSELYHKLHHYQYKLVKFCQSKIKRLKSESDMMESSEICLQALKDYTDECYDEFKGLSNEADVYLEEAV